MTTNDNDNDDKVVIWRNYRCGSDLFLLILSFFLNMYRDLEQYGRNFALPFGGENNHLLTN